MAEVNYMQVVPGSQYYTDIDQILESLKSTDLEWVKVGLQNSKNRGYNLKQETNRNALGEVIDSYLTDENIHKMD